LRQCREAWAARGTDVVAELGSGGADNLVDWRHYPNGEVYDPATHIQYFFHRHPAAIPGDASGVEEVGHFHLFLHGEGMPAGITPLVLPEVAVANAPLPRQSAPLKRGARDELSHLIAISIDRRGEAVRLFTTNRWVTGETWYRADDVIRMLEWFRPRGEYPSPLVNRWLGALVCLFEPEIAALLRRRDTAIAERRWRWPTDPLEDARLEVPSCCDVDLDARLAAVDGRDAELRFPTAQAHRLPRMAEGWGA
jgi:hypothetical protein